MSTRAAKDILDNPQLSVYDNPGSHLMCVYNRDKALCHRLEGLQEAPSLDRCQPPARISHAPTTTPTNSSPWQRRWRSRLAPSSSPSRRPTGSAVAQPVFAALPTSTTATASPSRRGNSHEPRPR